MQEKIKRDGGRKTKLEYWSVGLMEYWIKGGYSVEAGTSARPVEG